MTKCENVLVFTNACSEYANESGFHSISGDIAIFMPISPKLVKLGLFGYSWEDGGRGTEVTTCENVPILKNNCKYMNGNCINEIFAP